MSRTFSSRPTKPTKFHHRNLQEGISCGEERAELQHSLSLVSRQLSAARDELAVALDSADIETEEVQMLRAAAYRPQITVEPPMASKKSLGLVVLAVVSTVFAVAISIQQASAKAKVSTELANAIFDKENAEQSVIILEQELQRKMDQLSEAKEQIKVLSAPVPASPRIRAIQPCFPNSSGSPTISTGTGTLTPGRELPPPPQQLVERFLMERGAVAVEEAQVKAWLQMESDVGRLMREARKLQAAVEGKESHVQAQSEELFAMTVALEQQRQVAKQAKQALQAVRAAAAASGMGTGA